MGISFFSKKNSSEWISQTFTAESVGVDFQFGTAGDFMNPNAFIQGTSTLYDGKYTNESMGGVLIFTRKEGGDWNPSIDLFGSASVYFGAGIGVNEYDIIISGMTSFDSPATTSFYATPRCFFDPINVTCHNPQSDHCNNISLNQLYTINDPQCGTTAVTIDGLGFNADGGQARFTFTRGYDPSSVHCNATITCKIVQIQVPLDPVTQVPAAEAPVLKVPVAQSVTSSSNALQLGLFALLALLSSL